MAISREDKARRRRKLAAQAAAAESVKEEAPKKSGRLTWMVLGGLLLFVVIIIFLPEELYKQLLGLFNQRFGLVFAAGGLLSGLAIGHNAARVNWIRSRFTDEAVMQSDAYKRLRKQLEAVEAQCQEGLSREKELHATVRAGAEIIDRLRAEPDTRHRENLIREEALRAELNALYERAEALGVELRKSKCVELRLSALWAIAEESRLYYRVRSAETSTELAVIVADLEQRVKRAEQSGYDRGFSACKYSVEATP